MEQRVSLITLGVADLARARAFYEQGLGWRPARASQSGVVAFYQLGGMALALFGRADLTADAGLPPAAGEPPEAPQPGVALAHNVASREAVDALLARAQQAGGRLVQPALDKPWGGYGGYFADPDGHLWEVAWNPHFPLGPDGSLHLPE